MSLKRLGGGKVSDAVGIVTGTVLLLVDLIFCEQVPQAKSSAWDASWRAEIWSYDPLLA